MANALIHQIPLKIVGAIENIAIETKNQTDQLEVIIGLLAENNNSVPQCPANPECFAVLSCVYKIGICILAIEEYSTQRNCNECLNSIKCSPEFNNCKELLGRNPSLLVQFEELCNRMTGSSFVARAGRINKLSAFIYAFLLWCQRQDDGEVVVQEAR